MILEETPASGEAVMGQKLIFGNGKAGRGMLGVQILLPLPHLPHPPLLFMDVSPCTPQQLWEAFVSLQLLVESCSSSPDGCEPLGRIWVWMEFKGCGEGLLVGKHTEPGFLCPWLGTFVISDKLE